MNRIHISIILLGLFLMCASISACNDKLTLSGRSAKEVFKDEGVAKLLRAVTDGDATKAKRLVAAGVNVNAIGDDGITPLTWALAVDDLKAIKILLDLGANPNKSTLQGTDHVGLGPPIWFAARAGKKEELKAMLEHGGDPNLIFGNTSLLMAAIDESHLGCAELLLHYKADINLSIGPMSALTETMLRVQYSDAIWVLQHGYTHDLVMGRRMLAAQEPRLGQEVEKKKALEIIDKLISQQKRNKSE